MKDSIVATLYRPQVAFRWRMPLALGIITIAFGGVAGATDFSVSSSCGTSTPIFGSPAPVSIVDDGSEMGSGVRAASPLSIRLRTSAPAPNVLVGVSRDCTATASANHTDVIVDGPAATVLARVHVPFHANITQDFTQLTDNVSPFASQVSADLFYTAVLSGTGTFARGSVEFRLNREANDVQVLPFFATGAEFVPRPRIAGLIPLDPGGFITRFFQVSLPVSNHEFAGFATYTIDELRGEIILTTTVPTNQPLTLSFNVNVRNISVANYYASAAGWIDQGHLGVPIDGTVMFELPQGFTAQVPSAGVINNSVPPVFKCPRTATEWRSHPQDWPVTTMTLGSQTYAQNELLGILQTVVTAFRPDASVVLAQQLIAARLNEANASAPGPMLQPSMTADSILAGFAGKVPYRVLPNTALGQQMTNSALVLSRYNSGQLTSTCVP